MFRLVMLEDSELEEMEGIFPTDLKVLPNGVISQKISDVSGNHYLIAIVMMFVAFVMSITLMNLFIAVLTFSYTQFANKAKVTFKRHQARSVLAAQAMNTGWDG